MQNYQIIAVPQFENCGLQKEVLYKINGEISVDNPLSRFLPCKNMPSYEARLFVPGKGRLIRSTDLLYILRKAKAISSAFYGAWSRHYFGKKIGYLEDKVLLSDKDLISEYKCLMSGESSLLSPTQISLAQKELDYRFFQEEAKHILEISQDMYYRCDDFDINKGLKDYLTRMLRHKEAGMFLLKDRLSRLEYKSFKEYTSRCTAGECNWFGVMRSAESIRSTFSLCEKRKPIDNPYQFGASIAAQQSDMSSERIYYLMARAILYTGPRYDIYFCYANEQAA